MVRLNLSSKPFTNHRVFWICVVVVLLLSGEGLWLISQQKMAESREIDEIEGKIKSRQAMFDQTKEQEAARQRESDKIFMTDQDALLLASARQMIARKAFSWDKMLTDLEANIPKRARVTEIKVSSVNLSADGPMVSLDIGAVGASPAELTELMQNLEKTNGVFVVGDVGQGAATNDTGEIPFNLQAEYRPSARGRQ
jgi:Tfp pilus assembly protein PilN